MDPVRSDAAAPHDETLREALARLADALALLRFDLTTPAQSDRRRQRDRLARELEAHAARLRDVDAPLLVVFGGVTGAGKSTLVNTIVGEQIVTAGPLRPTTLGPTLVCHPDDVVWFDSDRVLADLARVRGRAAPGHLRIAEHAALTRGLALVDAPDVDSVNEGNRLLAEELLDAADVWVWCTTAGKYADEQSMAYLRRAGARDTVVGVVLTQVQPSDVDEIVADFREKLRAAGIGEVEILVVPWVEVRDAQVPAGSAADLRAWLLAHADPARRRAARMQTLHGALGALPDEIDELIGAVEDEMADAAQLLADVARAYSEAETEFDDALGEGLPLRAEVVDRWERFVGGGRLLKLAEAASGQARTWIRGLLAQPGAEEQRVQRDVRVEVSGTLTGTTLKLADVAAADVVARWSGTSAGRDLLARHDLVPRASAGFEQRAEDEVRAWQAHVVELVSTVGARHRAKARIFSGIVSVGATGAILAVLGTSGITGAEAGIAAAAGAANQGLLVKLLGEANLRWLVGESRKDLRARVHALMSQERARFEDAVRSAAPRDEQLAALRATRAALAAAPPA